jgi:hypothetical protein
MTALNDIRENWDALLTPTSSGGVASKPAPRSLYTRHDTDERDDDLPNLDRRIALRHDVTQALNSWARLIVEEKALTHHLPLGTDTIGLVEFLERWARWFSGHEAAGDASDELTALAGKVRATAAPQRRDWTFLGKCPLDIDTENGPTTCNGQVRAYPNRDPHCQRCGTEAVLIWWERVLFPGIETSELVIAEELAILLRRAFGGELVQPATIRKWQERGWFEKTGADDKGRTLYNRRHVIRKMSERQDSTA